MSRIAWQARHDLSLEEWVVHGQRLGMAGRHVGWWIGDWLRYGNAAYGERYARAAKITGYDTQTLMNMVYVATQVDVERRSSSLSWSHHAEVAALPDGEQQLWLERAEAGRLSVRDLREAIRCERRRAGCQGGAEAGCQGGAEAGCEEGAQAGSEGAEPVGVHGGADTIGARAAAEAVTCPGCGHIFPLAAAPAAGDENATGARLAAVHRIGVAA